MTVRIEGYISFKNYSKLNEIREKNNDKGFSTVLNHIVDKYFINLQQQDGAVELLNKVIQGYQVKIKNLEYEKEVKDNVRNNGCVDSNRAGSSLHRDIDISDIPRKKGAKKDSIQEVGKEVFEKKPRNEIKARTPKA